jgi:hypothetical protein
MKSTKQIREQFDLITEKEEKEDRKLSALVRAGLYDAKKLPALKRALDKSADKITSQEKRILISLLDSLISQVVSDDQVYRKVRQNVHNVAEAKMDTYSKFDPRYKAGWPTDKEMPSVLILKRKAIRVYPDNQKVALYYSQAIDKYVTIPYNDIQMGLNEAKKDDEKKKKYFIKLKRTKKDKSISKDGSVSDTKDLIQGKGQYKSKLSRANELRKAGFNIGGILGIMMHDSKRKERAMSSLAKVKAHMDKTRSSEPVKEAPAASTSVPKSKPAAPKAKATTGSTSTIRKKSPAATKAAMNKILKKNPKATFSKGASDQAGLKEDFKHRLSGIRESKQLNEQEQINEVLPYLAVAAGLGLRAAAGAAGRFFAGTAARGAAGTAGRGVVTRGAAGTAAKGAGKAKGKGLGKGKWLRRAGRLGALGALAGSLGGGSGSGSNASDKSASPNYEFKAKPGLKNSFADYKAPSDTTIRQTDYQLNKKAQKAMMGESNVLDTIKSIVENDISEQSIRFNENEITINNTVAKKLLNVYESVNKTNKKKMEQMLNESATSFNKVLTFAVRQ